MSYGRVSLKHPQTLINVLFLWYNHQNSCAFCMCILPCCATRVKPCQTPGFSGRTWQGGVQIPGINFINAMVSSGCNFEKQSHFIDHFFWFELCHRWTCGNVQFPLKVNLLSRLGSVDSHCKVET